VVNSSRNKSIQALARQEERMAWWLIAPTFAILALFALYPLSLVISSSFTNQRFASDQETRFVGLQNYRNLLSVTIRELPPVIDPATGNQQISERTGEPEYELWINVLPREPRRYRQLAEFSLVGRRYVIGATNAPFMQAVFDTMRFTVICILFETVLGLIIALTLHARFRGRGLMRAAMLVPWAVVTIVAVRMWEWMFQGNRSGFFNSLLYYLGAADGNVAFLEQANLQLASIIAIDVWKTTPFMALLLLAGLATIPNELYEAAIIDGANRLDALWRITLPLLAPTLAVALIFRTLDLLRVFELFQVIFGQRRYSMSSFAYDALVGNREVGVSSAASMIIFALIFVFAFLYLRLLKVDQHG